MSNKKSSFKKWVEQHALKEPVMRYQQTFIANLKTKETQREKIADIIFRAAAFGTAQTTLEILRQLASEPCTMVICSSKSEAMKRSKKFKPNIVCCDDLNY